MPETYRRDAQGRRIHIPDDPRRIDGLVAEARARTLTLFRPGNFAEHPTAPIDIAPFHDLLQGLGTHVKSIQRNRTDRADGERTAGTLELASTLELMRLDGHHRYLIMVYEIDGEIEIDGKAYRIRRYHTVIEAIASPATFAALRGGYTLAHLAWIQRRLDAYVPTRETIKGQQDRFKGLMKKFEGFFGIARPSVKLSMNGKTDKVDNKRVQSSIPLSRLQKQLDTEGDYQGRFTQPNYREWHEGETVYGLKLPWFTINSDHIFSTVGDPTVELDEKARKDMAGRQRRMADKRVMAPAPAPLDPSDDQRYSTEDPLGRTHLGFDGGVLTVVRQKDEARTISVDGADAEAVVSANRTCERLGARWLPLCGRWATDLETAKRIVAELGVVPMARAPEPEPDYVDPLPPAPARSALRPNPRNDRLFYFDVGTASAAAFLMKPHGNWVLMGQGNAKVAAIIAAACEPYAPQKPWDGRHDGDWTVRFNAEGGSWIVRDDPPELIERVVHAIQTYRP